MSETPIFTSVEHDLEVSYDDLAAEPATSETQSTTQSTQSMVQPPPTSTTPDAGPAAAPAS
ncbi:hypothetical protein SAMN04487968_10532 [Nocardioides terrae]|uniref:Uncharacterized protein n=1 Tax=Nocardioides terrae TaxID=574651 RepID=A0A1I1HWA2_9ACTN|nr:hypothetical protein [Nocardioides terrae]SFC28055.1 hypothetical protein SAMN04487968_10532 [Nocardioides terrae]